MTENQSDQSNPVGGVSHPNNPRTESQIRQKDYGSHPLAEQMTHIDLLSSTYLHITKQKHNIDLIAEKTFMKLLNSQVTLSHSDEYVRSLNQWASGQSSLDWVPPGSSSSSSSLKMYSDYAPKVADWFSQVLNVPVTSHSTGSRIDLIQLLWSGDLLCQLCCTLYPKVKCMLLDKDTRYAIHKAVFFLELCKSLHIKRSLLFSLSDLLIWPELDVNRKHGLIVLRTLLALEKHARKTGWKGPLLNLGSSGTKERDTIKEGGKLDSAASETTFVEPATPSQLDLIPASSNTIPVPGDAFDLPRTGPPAPPSQATKPKASPPPISTATSVIAPSSTSAAGAGYSSTVQVPAPTTTATIQLAPNQSQSQQFQYPYANYQQQQSQQAYYDPHTQQYYYVAPQGSYYNGYYDQQQGYHQQIPVSSEVIPTTVAEATPTRSISNDSPFYSTPSTPTTTTPANDTTPKRKMSLLRRNNSINGSSSSISNGNGGGLAGFLKSSLKFGNKSVSNLQSPGGSATKEQLEIAQSLDYAIPQMVTNGGAPGPSQGPNTKPDTNEKTATLDQDMRRHHHESLFSDIEVDNTLSRKNESKVHETPNPFRAIPLPEESTAEMTAVGDLTSSGSRTERSRVPTVDTEFTGSVHHEGAGFMIDDDAQAFGTMSPPSNPPTAQLPPTPQLASLDDSAVPQEVQVKEEKQQNDRETFSQTMSPILVTRDDSNVTTPTMPQDDSDDDDVPLARRYTLSNQRFEPQSTPQPPQQQVQDSEAYRAQQEQLSSLEAQTRAQESLITDLKKQAEEQRLAFEQKIASLERQERERREAEEQEKEKARLEAVEKENSLLAQKETYTKELNLQIRERFDAIQQFVEEEKNYTYNLKIVTEYLFSLIKKRRRRSRRLSRALDGMSSLASEQATKSTAQRFKLETEIEELELLYSIVQNMVQVHETLLEDLQVNLDDAKEAESDFPLVGETLSRFVNKVERPYSIYAVVALSGTHKTSVEIVNRGEEERAAFLQNVVHRFLSVNSSSKDTAASPTTDWLWYLTRPIARLRNYGPFLKIVSSTIDPKLSQWHQKNQDSHHLSPEASAFPSGKEAKESTLGSCIDPDDRQICISGVKLECLATSILETLKLNMSPTM